MVCGLLYCPSEVGLFFYLTFCSLLSSHRFPICSTPCPRRSVSPLSGFFFRPLPWSERRFYFLPVSRALVACGRVDESQPESVASCCRAGFYGETRRDASALASVFGGLFRTFIISFHFPWRQKRVVQSSSVNVKHRVVKADARVD